MGVFTVPIKLKNWQNRFLPKEEQGKDVECEALVDSGAIDLCLPVEIVQQLKLEQLDTVDVVTADGAEHHLRYVGMVEVEFNGRTSRVLAIELPRGSQPLLGAVPLEHMDWHISPNEQKLLPNPKSPDKPLLPLVGLQHPRR